MMTRKNYTSAALLVERRIRAKIFVLIKSHKKEEMYGFCGTSYM
jgi:hypothetical protein